MRQQIIRPCVPVIVQSGLNRCLTYALIDSGATISAIRLDTVDLIGARIIHKSNKLATFGKSEVAQRDFTSFEVMPLDKSFTIKIKDALVGDILSTENEKPPQNKLVEKYRFMEGVKFDELEDRTISLIIDVRHAWTWAGGEIRAGNRDEPIAMKTRWGWTVLGSQFSGESLPVQGERVSLLDSEKSELENMIKDIMSLDNS